MHIALGEASGMKKSENIGPKTVAIYRLTHHIVTVDSKK